MKDGLKPRSVSLPDDPFRSARRHFDLRTGVRVVAPGGGARPAAAAVRTVPPVGVIAAEAQKILDGVFIFSPFQNVKDIRNVHLLHLAAFAEYLSSHIFLNLFTLSQVTNKSDPFVICSEAATSVIKLSGVFSVQFRSRCASRGSSYDFVVVHLCK